MLVFRLFRVGKINQPSYKIVVTDKRNSSKGGRFVEQVGFYNPITKQNVLNKERIQYWLSQGVQPSPTVYNLFIKEGISEGKKISKHKKSKKPFDAAQGKAAAAPAVPAAPVVAPTAPAEAPKPVEKLAEKPAEAKPQIKEEKPAEKLAAKMTEAEPQSSEAPKTE